MPSPAAMRSPKRRPRGLRALTLAGAAVVGMGVLLILAGTSTLVDHTSVRLCAQCWGRVR